MSLITVTDLTLNEMNYDEFLNMFTNFLNYEKDWLANLSNTCSLLNNFLSDINWVGFYLLKQDELVLGPFQGKVACTRIAFGKGVCGTAIKHLKTMRVDDVHNFTGHIACDSDSRSEIVIPLFRNNNQRTKENLIGVLDIDSPNLDRFSRHDAEKLEELVGILCEKTQWPEFFA
ncbi:GAF domain-containing protein [Fluviispira sanaruensis]|uniref:Histidine kinase n=1 Tax=Fluviispira sanaruensis TaxID=2493639 RepID=A0A4P2VJX0_FLUSA|nr:GAF domain-containing protein [Fluviispira sanaruensis]BBH52848.1 histidine kinase [Fluviispira sanaruensis]